VADQTTLLEAIMWSATVFARADACDLQLLDPRTTELRIVASWGFPPAFLDHFAAVRPGDRTACRSALLENRPVAVRDVTRSGLFAGTDNLAVMLDAGSRSVRSYPLTDTAGGPIGVLSFHYRRPLDQLDHLRSWPDLVARQAALAIEWWSRRDIPRPGGRAGG
jgi:GAF domain-containing protein